MIYLKNLWAQSENYISNLKKIHLELSGLGLKILALLVVLIAWATTILATFSLLS